MNKRQLAAMAAAAKWQQQMLESVNKERKAAGLAELELDMTVSYTHLTLPTN